MSAFSNVIETIHTRYIFSIMRNNLILNKLNFYYQICTKMDMEYLFSEESVKRSEFSSSPRRSLTNSPEYSSLLKNTSFPVPDRVPNYGGALSHTATVRPYLSSIEASDQYCNIKFPTMKTEDLMITSALSAIFSSNSSATDNTTTTTTTTNGVLGSCDSGFKPYNSSSISPKFEEINKSCGQKMIKDSIAYLRKVNSTGDGAQNNESQPTTHQLHHMISERKRREKLNESFYELRLLLPPCSKVCNWT